MKYMTVVLVALVLAISGCKKGNGNALTGNVSVITFIPTDIIDTEATCGMKIMAYADVLPEEIGVCWSTTANPTIGDSFLSTKNCSSPFVCTLEGLVPETKYHVRAFALKGEECVYGNDKEFVTQVGGASLDDVPVGAICGVLSVSNGKLVYFSQGNLQYEASTNTWRFAENQWNFVGGTHYESGEQYGNVYENGTQCDNVLVSSDYDGWIDLFGWGTSGYNHGAVCYQPWSTSKDETDYYAYGSATCGLNDQTGQADWGCNAILNGGNQEHLGWRTLTKDEYVYLLVMRNTISGIRYAKAIVNEVPGLILLPDNWSSQKFDLNKANDQGAAYESNIISLSDWTTRLELNGAVFFPITGVRWRNNDGVVFSDIEENWRSGSYWTVSLNNTSTYEVFFYDKKLYPHDEIVFDCTLRDCGLGVRLVQDR